MMKSCVHLLVPAAILIALAAASPEGSERIQLFNGKNLEGWTVLGCEAVVDNGDILLKDGNGLVQSNKKYGDFIFEYEWKALAGDKWDSGVYFRYTELRPNRPWPARYQVNLRKGLEGNLDGVEGAVSEGMTKPGEWNKFKLTVIGGKVSLDINGKPAWKASGLEEPYSGYIALQSEVPNGGQFRFRNIYVTELKSAE